MSVALVAGLATVGLAAPSHAATVTYTTTGLFTGGDAPGTNQYIDAANNILITFNGVTSNSVEVPPDSNVSYGTFDTTGTTAASLQAVASGFTLTIIQSAPTPSGDPDIAFVGALDGSLAFSNSQAFVQFLPPFIQNISNGDGTQTQYRLVEADEGTPGRANINPPSVNNGDSTVEGKIVLIGQQNVVPEPSSILMASLAVPALLLYGRNRKVKATA